MHAPHHSLDAPFHLILHTRFFTNQQLMDPNQRQCKDQRARGNSNIQSTIRFCDVSNGAMRGLSPNNRPSTQPGPCVQSAVKTHRPAPGDRG
jgi:hypothetical protein